MRRTATKLLTALALVAVGVVPIGAQADEAAGTGPDNVVWVTTTGTAVKDQRSGFQIGLYDGNDLRSANVARAESRDCTDCRTVAVAVQAVIATDHPQTVAPTNAALAINDRCERCSTYAYAWQYVVTTDQKVRPSRRARIRIAAIREDIEQVAHSDLAPADMDARLNALTADFKATIDAELARTGAREHGEVEKQRDAEQ
jgi:hypothetical protein